MKAIMKRKLLATLTVAALAGLPGISQAEGLPYADTEWPSIHQGPDNADYTSVDTGRVFRTKWTALEGASTMCATTTGPEGNLYVTTGQGVGNSNLHALDRDGNLLWESDPMTDVNGLDGLSVMESPIVDDAGDLYVGDANQILGVS